MSIKVRQNEQYGFYQLDPVPETDELSSFYESKYYDLIRQGGRAPEIRRLMETGEDGERERAWLRHTLYADIAHYLEHLAPGGTVLDVGAGTGDLVSFLAENGFNASGIEPSRDASALAGEKNITVHCATLEAWAQEDANRSAYDAVVLINVMEHVPNPEETLRLVRALLKEGGIVCLRLPNDFSEVQESAQSAMNAEPWWVSAPDHINYFTMSSLVRLFDGMGFDCEKLTADFPMELFLLMGEDYVRQPDMGGICHERRRKLEFALPTALRRKLYEALAAVGAGRNTLAFGRLRAR